LTVLMGFFKFCMVIHIVFWGYVLNKYSTQTRPIPI